MSHQQQVLYWSQGWHCVTCGDTAPQDSKGLAMSHAREFPGHRVVFTETTVTEHVFVEEVKT